MLINNAYIRGIGSYLPDKKITNLQIENNINTTDKWIQDKLGIKERRVCTTELPSDLGYKAALAALENAKIDKEDIDLIIVATSSPEQISPATSCIINNKLNIQKNIPSFDINAVCSGFLYALSISSNLISSGAYKNILIIATESYSKITNWNDQHCVFFGDGAGAIVLSKSKRGWMCSNIEANGKETGMTGFILPKNDFFKMNGKEVWEQAIKVLPESIINIMKETNTSVEDIKMLVPHQPSINILKIVANKVNLPFNKVKTVMDKYANIAGASIPIALDEAIKNKEIVYGDKIILTAIGSGWTWGSLIMNYEE